MVSRILKVLGLGGQRPGKEDRLTDGKPLVMPPRSIVDSLVEQALQRVNHHRDTSAQRADKVLALRISEDQSGATWTEQLEALERAKGALLQQGYETDELETSFSRQVEVSVGSFKQVGLRRVQQRELWVLPR